MTIGEKTYELGYMSALGGKKRCISLTESTIVELSKTLLPQKWGTVYINTTGERIQTHFTSREVGERKKYQD